MGGISQFSLIGLTGYWLENNLLENEKPTAALGYDFLLNLTFVLLVSYLCNPFMSHKDLLAFITKKKKKKKKD